MYDLTQLKTLVTVVQEGHLTRASARLHISQPTASHHIRALESHFGLPLFRRTPRGLEVTAGGKRIAEWATNVLQASHELDHLARGLVGVPAGRLAIGTIANQRVLEVLPGVVRTVRDRFPMTEFSFEPGNSWAIREALKTGELDAGVVVATVGDDDLKCHPLETLDYVLAAPAAWRERVGQARPAQLARLPWIVTGRGTPSQELIDRRFRAHGLEIHVAAEVGNASLLHAMVGGEVGVGFMLVETALQGARDGTLFVVPRFQETLPLNFIHAQARSSDVVLSCFAQALTAGWQAPAPRDPPLSPLSAEAT